MFIEDANGKILRHLVAGVLGANAPEPLKPGLAQSIEWDGKADNGKPVGDEPFKVRVALGLEVKYEKIAIRDEQALNNIRGLAVGLGGTVYVLDVPGGAVWQGEQITAFGRDGRYRRNVMPFPANLPMEKVEDLAAMELRGGVDPIVQGHRLKLFPGRNAPRKTGMAVTPESKALLRLTGGGNGSSHIEAVGTDGSVVWSDVAGPAQTLKAGGTRGNWSRQPALAVPSDRKWPISSASSTGRARPPSPFARRCRRGRRPRSSSVTLTSPARATPSWPRNPAGWPATSRDIS